MRLWDLKSGVELLSLLGHEGPVFAVALSPDGRLAASGGVDQVIRVWDLQEGRQAMFMVGHLEPVWSLAFTPDGRRLLSAGSDEVVRLWDLEQQSEIGAAERAALARADLPEPQTESERRGADLFKKCSICHTVSENGSNRAGPNLHGVFGRRAGTVQGYKYSKSLRDSDLVWNEQTIDALFAEGPADYTPGSKMPLQRMPDARDRADLIAYLKRITTPGSSRLE